MRQQIEVFKGRTTIIPVSLGYDVSTDTFKSEIRAGKTADSELIATWEIDFATDGTDGELVFTLDDLISAGVNRTIGYMDLKRITNGEPVNVFGEPLEVVFKESITV